MQRGALSLILLAALIGCSVRSSADVDAPEQLVILSLDGRDPIEREGRRGKGVPPSIGEFHGYPVLGQVEITDPVQRAQLLATLKEAIDRRGVVAKCFWPRHGVRAVKNGETIEYVICFECGQFDEYLGGQRVRHESIDSSVHPAFDAPLTEQGIPIVPR
jgi:hypothetical protein